ncbi:MAG: zinc-ribbon domain-containing protein, partial [Armatimonadetes bacterium]|nr:zinc-ribbon domain-containing protein [Armatimonadota bacterium]
MRLEKCPRCGAKVQPTDTICLDCGLDLVEARKKIAAEAKQAAPQTSS